MTMDAFFGLQLAVHSPPLDPWRTRLCAVLRRHQQDLRIGDQRTFLGVVANLLQEALPRAELAFWDYVADGKSEYADWTRGLEDDSQETWAPDTTAANEFVLVTAAFLLPDGGDSQQLVGERCDLPESDWMRRDTIEHLVETIAMLRPRSVRCDGIYVTPGGVDLGFSRRELQGDGYEYLQPIKG